MGSTWMARLAGPIAAMRTINVRNTGAAAKVTLSNCVTPYNMDRVKRGERPGACQAASCAKQNQNNSFGGDHSQNPSRWRAHRHPDADLARSENDEVRHNAINAGRGEQNRNGGEGSDENKLEALGGERRVTAFVHGFDIRDGLVAVYCADVLLDGADGGFGVARGADREACTINAGARARAEIHQWIRVRAQCGATNIAHYANDCPLALINAKNEAPAQRVLSRKDTPDEGFVYHDGRLCRSSGIMLIERASTFEWDSERLEELAANNHAVRNRSLREW